MSYSTIAYMIRDHCSILCLECIEENIATEVEKQALRGEFYYGETVFWPRRQRGELMRDEQGDIIYREVEYDPQRHKARTEDGEEIEEFSEYSFGDTEDGEYCECGKVLIEPYKITCRACGEEAAEGSRAAKIERNTSVTLCEKCATAMARLYEKSRKLYESYIPLYQAHDNRWYDTGHVLKAWAEKIEEGEFYISNLLEGQEVYKSLHPRVMEWEDGLNDLIKEFRYTAKSGNAKAKLALKTLEKLQRILREARKVIGEGMVEEESKVLQTLEALRDTEYMY